MMTSPHYVDPQTLPVGYIERIAGIAQVKAGVRTDQGGSGEALGGK
jgi:hypothetical protein